MTGILVLALVVLAGVAPLQAQIENNTMKERIRQEILEKKRLMREGKVIRTNVRVTVRLHNKSRLEGVVKNGRFIERVDGLSFVPTDMVSPGAGLRLWYYDNTDSYIFLPYHSILSHKIGQQLTDAEVRAIAEKIERERKEAEQRAQERAMEIAEKNARKKQQEQLAKGTAGKPIGAPPAGDPDSKLSPEQLAVLAEYPPEEGWSLDRLREIEAKKVTLGVYPDAKSQRFLEVFPQWNEAHELKRSLTPEVPALPPGTPGQPAPPSKPK